MLEPHPLPPMALQPKWKSYSLDFCLLSFYLVLLTLCLQVFIFSDVLVMVDGWILLLIGRLSVWVGMSQCQTDSTRWKQVQGSRYLEYFIYIFHSGRKRWCAVPLYLMSTWPPMEKSVWERSLVLTFVKVFKSSSDSWHRLKTLLLKHIWRERLHFRWKMKKYQRTWKIRCFI